MAGTTKSQNPKNVTVRGRLSYPIFSYAEAVKRDAGSQYAKADPTQVSASFNLLLEPAQLEKVKKHILDVFLPYCREQEKAGQKRDALTQAQVDELVKLVESEDWDNQPPYIFIKSVPEKTQPLAPECVANLRIKGTAGQDIEQKAVVSSEDDLLVPDPDYVPGSSVIKPIGQTTHSLYGGCQAKATLSLFSFVSGKKPGFSAGANVIVFWADDDRFGGGSDLDLDEIFLDD